MGSECLLRLGGTQSLTGVFKKPRGGHGTDQQCPVRPPWTQTEVISPSLPASASFPLHSRGCCQSFRAWGKLGPRKNECKTRGEQFALGS